MFRRFSPCFKYISRETKNAYIKILNILPEEERQLIVYESVKEVRPIGLCAILHEINSPMKCSKVSWIYKINYIIIFVEEEN